MFYFMVVGFLNCHVFGHSLQTRVKSVAQKLRKNLPECVTFEVPRVSAFVLNNQKLCRLLVCPFAAFKLASVQYPMSLCQCVHTIVRPSVFTL